MPRDQTKKQTTPFEIRPGGQLVGPVFRGMRREGNAGNIPLNQFQHLQNVRLTGGDIESRGGQSATGDAVDDCIPGIDGSDPDSLLSILINSDGDGAVYYYNPDLIPPGYNLDVSTWCYISALPGAATASIPRRALVVHNEEPYFYGGNEGILWKLTIGTDATNPATERSFSKAALLGPNVGHLISTFGEVWVSYVGGQVRSFSFETGALSDRGATGLIDPVILMRYRETVYACGRQQLRRWDGGTTWTVVSDLTDTVEFSPRCGLQVMDVLYIGGQELDGQVPDSQYQAWYYAFNGTTATGTRLVISVGQDTESSPDVGGVIDIAEMDQEPLFAWNPNGEAQAEQREGRITRLNGDFARIGTDFTGVPPDHRGMVTSILNAGGVLYACVLVGLPGAAFARRLLRFDGGSILGLGTEFWVSDSNRNAFTSVAVLNETEGDLLNFQSPADMCAVL